VTTFRTRKLIAAVLVPVAIAAGPTLVGAQFLTFSGIKAKPDSTTVSGCVVLTEKSWNKFFESQGDKKLGPEDFAKAEADTRAVARRCAAKFALKSVPSRDLRALAILRNLAGDIPGSIAAIEHATNGAPDSQKVAALKLGVDVSLRRTGIITRSARPTPEDFARAEEFARRLDEMGAGAAPARLYAHFQLMRSFDSTHKAQQDAHMSQAFVAAKEITGEAKKASAREIALLYEGVANQQRVAGDSSKAQETIRVGLQELAEFPNIVSGLKALDLIGRPSPQLVATHWFNAPTGTTEITPRGKVYLVMMTATW
jgi:hypothetical protein